MERQDNLRTDEDRRAFLQTAGKVAVVVPPAMAVLLSTGMSSSAIAASGSSLNRDGDDDGDDHGENVDD